MSTTGICRFYADGLECRYGDRCRFAHVQPSAAQNQHQQQWKGNHPQQHQHQHHSRGQFRPFKKFRPRDHHHPYMMKNRPHEQRRSYEQNRQHEQDHSCEQRHPCDKDHSYDQDRSSEQSRSYAYEQDRPHEQNQSRERSVVSHRHDFTQESGSDDRIHRSRDRDHDDDDDDDSKDLRQRDRSRSRSRDRKYVDGDEDENFRPYQRSPLRDRGHDEEDQPRKKEVEDGEYRDDEEESRSSLPTHSCRDCDLKGLTYPEMQEHLKNKCHFCPGWTCNLRIHMTLMHTNKYLCGACGLYVDRRNTEHHLKEYEQGKITYAQFRACRAYSSSIRGYC